MNEQSSFVVTIAAKRGLEQAVAVLKAVTARRSFIVIVIATRRGLEQVALIHTR